MNQNFNLNSSNMNFQYESIPKCNRSFTAGIYRSNSIKNTNSIEERDNNKLRMDNLEDRISSLEKMLQYLDEFIHLKQEEKDTDFQNNLMIDQLNVKINLLEKEIRILHKEKNENKKIIIELNNKIQSLERQINNNNYNNMQDIIFSLSNKEKKLNMLINEFHDMTKKSDLIINNKLTEKINEFNIFNENRISELLALIQNINSIIEQNEFKVSKINENIQNIQKDNLNMVKIISVQEQKFNSFELINNEINSIKEKIRILIDDYDNKIENSYY